MGDVECKIPYDEENHDSIHIPNSRPHPHTRTCICTKHEHTNHVLKLSFAVLKFGTGPPTYFFDVVQAGEVDRLDCVESFLEVSGSSFDIPTGR